MTSKEIARENAELLDVNTQLLLRLEQANVKIAAYEKEVARKAARIEKLLDRISDLGWAADNAREEALVARSRDGSW